MSGGIAYVYDKSGDFYDKCNTGMVELGGLSRDDEYTVQKLLRNHHRCTQSPAAKEILDDFARKKRRFVKVMPIEYKRILEERAMKEEELDLMGVSDG